MTPQHRIRPIMGAFYRPPAKGILASLPQGTPLRLRLESDNAYDPNAVAIWLNTNDLAVTDSLRQRLSDECLAFGHDAQSVLEQAEWHLGYVPAKQALDVRADMADANELIGELAFGPTGAAIAYQPITNTSDADASASV